MKSQQCGTQVVGFFPGVSAPLVGGSLEAGVNYLVYTKVLEHLTHSRTAAANANAQALSCAAPAPELQDVCVAAAVAGVALSLILGPVELVKCRVQVRRAEHEFPERYVTTLRCAGSHDGRGLCVATLCSANTVLTSDRHRSQDAVVNNNDDIGNADNSSIASH